MALAAIAQRFDNALTMEARATLNRVAVNYCASSNPFW